MKNLRWKWIAAAAALMYGSGVFFVLSSVSLPGTQPNELTNTLRAPSQCNCHETYDSTSFHEPYDTWAGSMMAQAARDPLFWATVDIAEQDVPGVGDLCIRCHSPKGWLEGRSGPPFDGSLLTGDDFEGLFCDFCHRMYEGPTGVPYTENGQYWISNLTEKRGPYDDATTAQHGYIYSPFHVDNVICGVCHNVTNPLINMRDENTGADLGIKMPVERTYKEWLQSAYSDSLSENYKNCNACHMPDVHDKKACSKGSAPVRADVAMHQFAGGSSWMLNLLKGEFASLGRAASFDWTIAQTLNLLQNTGAGDAVKAADMTVTLPPSIEEGYLMPVAVTVTNLTGHKLPTGYPEGRRMWLNLEVRDGKGALIFESGAYDPASAVLSHDAQAKIYEAKPGIWGKGVTFHFVLNDYYAGDNRIPPLGFLPDIETRPRGYSYPEVGGGKLANWDVTDYQVPIPLGLTGTLTVTARLRYQSTSKEYITFLEAQNTTTARGTQMRQLWEQYGKAPPVDMNVEQGSVAAQPCTSGAPGDTLLAVGKNGVLTLDWGTASGAAFYRVYRHQTRDLSDEPFVFETHDRYFDDDVLNDGKSYYYRVECVNGCGTTS